MEQLIILLLIGLISLINWIIQKSRELRERRKLEAEEIGEALRQEPSQTQEQADPTEAMRRLREALGLPDEAPEPKPVAERPPPLPKRPAPQPKRSTSQSAAPPRLPTPPPWVPTPPQPRLHRWETRTPAIVPEIKAPSQIRLLLSSAQGLRDAFVLSEILAPPLSQRSQLSGKNEFIRTP